MHVAFGVFLLGCFCGLLTPQNRTYRAWRIPKLLHGTPQNRTYRAWRKPELPMPINAEFWMCKRTHRKWGTPVGYLNP